MRMWDKALLMVFHPIDCLDIIKREQKQFKPWTVAFLYIAAAVVNYLYLFLVHFPLENKNPADASLLAESAMVVLPLFSWVIGAYAVTAIMSGESHFTELLTASAYSLVPYIVIVPILGIISKILSTGEQSAYRFVKTAVLLWVLVLLFVALKHLNDYSLVKALAVTLLSVVAVAIMWAVCLVLFSLTIQLVYFFIGFAEEINTKFFMR